MKDFQPYFTNDGSVGLYSDIYEDIYHSASGALTEAYEKFIYPINWNSLLKNNEIKILDICYGIGYNTKSFLNYVFENKNKLLNLKKKIRLNNSYTDTIHNDNINIYNDTIYHDNIFDKINITAVDNDKILMGISPFIRTGVKNFKNKQKFLEKHNVYKYFSKSNSNFPKISNLINYQILLKILNNTPEIFEEPLIEHILTAKSYNDCFLNDLKAIFFNLVQKYPSNHNRLNLHNIYYHYVSNRYKKTIKYLNIQDFSFTPIIDDARNVVANDNNLYNLIFLDAFTPSKCPCLWSYDFFKRLFEVMTDDGMLLTYSSSAQIRSAMKEAGFFIGKTYNERLNKFQGTIAAKNRKLIEHTLSETEIGLLNTKAGIFYRDFDFRTPNDEIIEFRNNEVKNSNRLSSSQFLKLRRQNGL